MTLDGKVPRNRDTERLQTHSSDSCPVGLQVQKHTVVGDQRWPISRPTRAAQAFDGPNAQ